MKINNTVGFYNFSMSSKTDNIQKTAIPNSYPNVDSFAQDNKEYLGRSMVNFGNSDNSYKKNSEAEEKEKDEIFIDNSTKMLRLSDEKKQIMTNFIEKYLKEYGFKSLGEIGTDNWNEQAFFVDKVSEELNINENDKVLLICELGERFTPDYGPCEPVYYKDYAFVTAACRENDLSDDETAVILNKLSDIALETNAPDLFCVFDKKNNPSGVSKLSYYLKNVVKYNEDKAADIMISLNKVAMVESSKRIEPEYKPDKDIMADMINTATAVQIKKKFNLKDDSQDYIKKILYKYVNPGDTRIPDAKPNLGAAAYYIADKYDLTAQQQAELMKIFE